MNHQHILDQWAELQAMIDAARATTDHPDAHACMDALKRMADDHTALVIEKKAEHDAAHADHDDTPHE